MEEHSRFKAAGRGSIAEAWQNRRTRGWVPRDQTVWGQRGRREEGWVPSEKSSGQRNDKARFTS